MSAKFAFEMRKIVLPLESIFPIRQIKDPHKTIVRYKTILSGIKEVGLLEPLMVHPQKGCPGKYVVVDGHLRLLALKELGETHAVCLIANDDESFTYNARVSRLSPIQEHKMIVKAVNNGVAPAKIAAALNIPLSQVKAAITLLDGIHEEAAELLKDKNICPKAIRLLKKVNSMRQIEIAELMVSANSYMAGYAEALVLGTPQDQLANPDEPKQKEGLTSEDIAKLEAEMETVERDLRSVEQTYGENNLNLTVAKGYLKRLLDNAKVLRFLTANHREILSEFETIAAAEGL
jgi:ParB-like chromosome segregation protein Spo0J